jgi:hypothetical protein
LDGKRLLGTLRLWSRRTRFRKKKREAEKHKSELIKRGVIE